MQVRRRRQAHIVDVINAGDDLANVVLDDPGDPLFELLDRACVVVKRDLAVHQPLTFVGELYKGRQQRSNASIAQLDLPGAMTTTNAFNPSFFARLLFSLD